MFKKNPFKKAGFDSLLSSNVHITGGVMELSGDELVIFNGNLQNEKIHERVTGEEACKAHLVIGGVVATGELELHNLTVTGELRASVVKVPGTLAIKAGARVTADVLQYRHLIIENGAVVAANMAHMDHA